MLGCSNIETFVQRSVVSHHSSRLTHIFFSMIIDRYELSNYYISWNLFWRISYRNDNLLKGVPTTKQLKRWLAKYAVDANLFRVQSSILTRTKRATNRNNVTTEKRRQFFFYSTFFKISIFFSSQLSMITRKM